MITKDTRTAFLHEEFSFSYKDHTIRIYRGFDDPEVDKPCGYEINSDGEGVESFDGVGYTIEVAMEEVDSRIELTNGKVSVPSERLHITLPMILEFVEKESTKHRAFNPLCEHS